MSVLRKNPIFVLKGIAPKTLRDNYFQGRYENLETPSSKINVSEVFYLNTPTFGCTPEDPRYQFKDQNNVSIVVLTTNTKNYTIYKEKKHYITSSNTPRRCPWCLEDYVCEPVRIPVRMETFNLETKTQFIFWDAGICCCSFGCAIGWCRREAHVSPCYQQSQYLLSLLFKMMYPNQELIETPPFNMLSLHGGPLSVEEYRKHVYKYERTNNLVFLPVKEEYLQHQV